MIPDGILRKHGGTVHSFSLDRDADVIAGALLVLVGPVDASDLFVKVENIRIGDVPAAGLNLSGVIHKLGAGLILMSAHFELLADDILFYPVDFGLLAKILLSNLMPVFLFHHRL